MTLYWDIVYNLHFLNISPGRLKTQQNCFISLQENKVGTVRKGSNELNFERVHFPFIEVHLVIIIIQ